MTAPQVPLENQNQNQNPDPNQTPTENLETPTQGTPPQNTDVVPRSEVDQQLNATHSLYRQTLIEAETQRRNLQAQLDAANARIGQNAPQQVPDDQLTPAQLIQREVRASVAPLLDEFSLFRQQQQVNTYQTIKNNFKSLPQFSPFWNALEPFLDQEMRGKEITVENVQNSLAIVIGRAQMQAALNPQPIQQNLTTQQPNNMPNNNPPQQQPQQNLPPHLRPSAPPLPNRNGNQNLTPNGNQLRQLTELEKRVARENKLTDAQYIDWISEEPANVIHSQIGIPPRQS